MLTILDHDFGNIGSVVRAIQFLKIPHALTRDLKVIEKADKLVLPGVGSYKAAVDGFLHGQLRDLIRHRVLEKEVPLFGFCLGLQLLSETGEEMGESQGLGLVQGRVKKMRVDAEKFAVPHMGWNDVQQNGLSMFKGLPADACFYFVHSFELMTEDPEVKMATVNYGGFDICAAIQKNHIWGAQFHPEKSQSSGLQLLKNFSEF